MTLERRWYIHSHSFAFNRYSRLKYGGVLLTHTDEENQPFCYDDHIENIRVKKLYGYGKKYLHPLTNSEDFLFSKFGWENNYSKEKKHYSYYCCCRDSSVHRGLAC